MLRVADSRELQAAVLAFKAADRATQKIVRGETARVFRPVWQSEVRSRASRMQSIYPYPRMLKAGVGLNGSNPPTATAYAQRRPLSGGLVPADRWKGAEFGTDRKQVITRKSYTRKSKNGGTHEVRWRHTARQQPRLYRGGYVVFPVVKEVAPRVVAYWVQSIVRAYQQAAEGRV